MTPYVTLNDTHTQNFEMLWTRKTNKVVVVWRYDETVLALEPIFCDFPCELVIINHAENTENALSHLLQKAPALLLTYSSL